MLENQGYAVINAVINTSKQQFPHNRTLSFYVLGSLAHGGFSSVSDVDMAIILSDPTTPEDAKLIGLIQQQVKSLGIPFADRLSIFWTSPNHFDNPTQYGRFPALDRFDFIEHAKLIEGPEVRGNLPLPTPRELEEDGATFIGEYLLSDSKQSELLDPQKIINQGARYLTKFVLFPVRLLFTVENPKIISTNSAAVEWYLQQQGNAAQAELVKYAFTLRNHDQNATVNEALPLLQKSLFPLYLQLLETYHQRMLHYDNNILAQDLDRLKSKFLQYSSSH